MTHHYGPSSNCRRQWKVMCCSTDVVYE